MGDASDQSDLERFMRSVEGEQHLKTMRAMLSGHRIQDVTFSNEDSCIALTLHLDDESTFVVYPPSLEVYVLRQEFEEVIEREYFLDYPERVPKG